MSDHPLKRGISFVKTSSQDIRTQYSRAGSRTLHLAGISGAGNILLGLGKIGSGLLSLSLFACVNGLYTLGMVLARYCALAGAVRGADGREQYRYCRWSGVILIIASLLYVAYSAWSYFHPRQISYHMYLALAIATFTFTEIGLNIRGVIINRKNKTPLLHAIKTINLAASLISLVLTQAAILAFTDEGAHDPSVNALLGLLMGACAALLGVYMLRHITRMEQLDTAAQADHASGRTET